MHDGQILADAPDRTGTNLADTGRLSNEPGRAADPETDRESEAESAAEASNS